MPGLTDDSVERQEIHCHNCDKYVQFPIDLALDGNHVLNCPNCDHEHCRVVKNGKITEERWGQRNGPTYYVSPYQTNFTVTSVTTTVTSAYMYFSAGTTGTY